MVRGEGAQLPRRRGMAGQARVRYADASRLSRLPSGHPTRLPAACPAGTPRRAGTWPHEVEAVDGRIVITRADGSQATLTYSGAASPADVDWAAAGVEVALECSGKFLTRAKLQPFLDAVRGARPQAAATRGELGHATAGRGGLPPASTHLPARRAAAAPTDLGRA